MHNMNGKRKLHEVLLEQIAALEWEMSTVLQRDETWTENVPPSDALGCWCDLTPTSHLKWPIRVVKAIRTAQRPLQSLAET